MRGYALFILISALATGSAWILAGRYGTDVQAPVIRSVAVICATAGIVAMAPLAWAASKRPGYLIQAAMAAIVLRLILSLSGGMAYQWWVSPPEGLFITSLGVAYITMLVMETGMVVFITRKHWSSSKAAH